MRWRGSRRGVPSHVTSQCAIAILRSVSRNVPAGTASQICSRAERRAAGRRARSPVHLTFIAAALARPNSMIPRCLPRTGRLTPALLYARARSKGGSGDGRRESEARTHRGGPAQVGDPRDTRRSPTTRRGRPTHPARPTILHAEGLRGAARHCAPSPRPRTADRPHRRRDGGTPPGRDPGADHRAAPGWIAF